VIEILFYIIVCHGQLTISSSRTQKRRGFLKFGGAWQDKI